jgi:hypothetical protein
MRTPVGAKLARDDGGSVGIDVDRAAAIASKLCSYKDLERTTAYTNRSIF